LLDNDYRMRAWRMAPVRLQAPLRAAHTSAERGACSIDLIDIHAIWKRAQFLDEKRYSTAL